MLVVLSAHGAVYDEVASAIRSELPGVDLVEGTGDSIVKQAVEPSVVVAVGARACHGAAQSTTRASLLCVLLPRSALDSATRAARDGRAMGGIVLDQPIARQLALVQLTVPEAREVAVLLGRESSMLESTLARAARERRLRLATARVSVADELYPALQGVLANADVLLAVPDVSVFNSGTAQNVLRTAFHARVPLIAFSPAYVKAGALAAVYTTPSQIGRQAGRLLKDFFAGRALPAVQAPRDFEVSINLQVAHALGIKLDDEMHIAERLRRMEPGK